MKYKYIAVIHKFFVYSEGFEVVELGELTDKEANAKKHELYYKNDRSTSKCAVRLIKLDKTDRVYKSRKLSWYERLTGYLKEEK